MFRILIAILVSFNLHLVLANSGIKDFSSKFKSPIPQAKTSEPEFPFKAEITKERIPVFRTAVLWHAPQCASLAPQREPSEEMLLDQEAIKILLDGLALQNPSYAKLAKQAKHKFHLLELGASLIESNLPFVDFNLANQANTKENFEQINSSIYRYYQGLKEFYKPQINRNTKLLETHTMILTKLESLCGKDSVSKVEALLNGARC